MVSTIDLGKQESMAEGTTFGFTGPQRRFDPAHLDAAAKALNLPRVPSQLLAQGRQAASAKVAKQSRGGARRLDERVVDRITLGWSVFEQEQIEEMGLEAYLEQQLDASSIEDFGLDQILEEAFPSIAMTNGERFVNYYEDQETLFIEFELATLYRAIYSPRQLKERMVIFWSDHFHVSLFSDFGIFMKPGDDRDVARAHALGKFPDLLRASAHSPAMLSYLTNDSNTRQHPNENYARELMELHTLGVDGGYTEADVKEVARCFTGWTYTPYEALFEFGQFHFDPAIHDFGAKTVLGHTIPAGGGQSDAETVLDILATHPSTADFISRKMLRYLWGYEPDDEVVGKIAKIYLDTGGDIPSMLRGIFRWWRMATSTSKLKRPFHLMVSAVRGLFGELENPFAMMQALFAAGHLPFTWQPPNGFPDSEGYWSGFVLPRFNFAADFLRGEDRSVVLDLPFLDPQLPAEDLVILFDLLLLDFTMTEDTRGALQDFLAGPRDAARVADALALVVSSPEFQRY